LFFKLFKLFGLNHLSADIKINISEPLKSAPSIAIKQKDAKKNFAILP